jgi:uncharacterized cupin superfamily protein
VNRSFKNKDIMSVNMNIVLDITSVFRLEDTPLTEPAVPIDPSTVSTGANVVERTRIIYADAAGELTVGLWESSPGAWHIETVEEEYIRLLYGEIRLSDSKGGSRHFGPGDSFFVPERFRGVWESIGEVRKIFVSLKRKRS